MKFVAFERSKQGTGASRRLRNSGRTPGIVYGSTTAPQLIELDHNALWHALKKEGFHASILEMEFNGQSSQVLLRDYQMHPYKQLVQHIDFQRVDANTTLHMKVPLHFSGEEESEAVKTDKCLINHVVTEIEVACLPANLPEFIAIDLKGLTMGVSLHLNDIALPAGCKAITHGKKNPVLVSVVAPVEEVVVAPVAAPATDAKGKGKGKK